MLAALSGALMLFLDRLILSHYSLDSMNAVAAVGNVCAIFQFSAVAIASIAEVFVGQYNGAKQYHKIAQPIWQMIWFSLATSVIFIPIGIWVGPLIVPDNFENLGLPYFKLLMVFGPLLPLIGTFAAFFVGRGKTRLVIFAAIVGNVLNLVLDLILIFGIEPYIPSMGPLGAANATVFSQSIQVLILAVVFFLPKYRKRFNTHKMSLNFPLLWQCLKIGTPNSVAHAMEIAAWSFSFLLMDRISQDHVTILSIGQTIYILFAFLTDGMEKGITALASNFLGSKQLSMLPKLFNSSLIMLAGILLFLAIPLLLYPAPLINGFSVDPHLYNATILSLHLIWVFFLFDGLVWLIAGFLTSGGDTKFIMLINTATVWFLAIIPIYYFVNILGGPPHALWAIIAMYGALNAGCFYWRYRSGKWLKFSVA